MTKSELILVVATKQEIPLPVAEKLVNEVFGSMIEALIDGDRIEIRGFGSFCLRQYAARIGRNPLTQEKVKVKARRAPFFKVGKELKEKIQAGSK